MKLLFIGFATVDIYPDGQKIPGGAAGGMSLNAAKLGNNSWLLAPLGADENGKFYTDYLHQYHVHTQLCIECPHQPTCVITDPFGASFKRDWSDHGARDFLLQTFIDPDCFISFDGIILANTLPEYVDYIETLLPSEVPIFYIPGPHIVHRPNLLNTQMLKRATIVCANAEEYPIVEANLDNNQKPEILVNTLGADGCNVVSTTGTHHFDAPKLKTIVDATGAGDCFALGFIVEYLHSKNIDRSVKAANQLAEGIIQKQGVLL